MYPTQLLQSGGVDMGQRQDGSAGEADSKYSYVRHSGRSGAAACHRDGHACVLCFLISAQFYCSADGFTEGQGSPDAGRRAEACEAIQ